MELLIPGLILVALMVYVSTRIKRAAAAAFEEEQIIGDGFTLTKPEGFLHKINNSDYPFEAYSKQFGTGGAEKERAATAIVYIDRLSIEKTAADEKARLTTVGGFDEFELGENHCVVMKGKRVRSDNAFDVSSKLIQSDGTTFLLRIEVLEELSDEFSRKTDEMLTSFSTN